jgi:phenylalanyl-tRNA synthetase alpha chain
MPDHPLYKQLEELALAVDTIATAGAEELPELRTRLLGRKAGKLTHILRGLRDLEGDERRDVGQRANQLKRRIEAAFEAREAALAAPDTAVGDVDLTMAARRQWRGAIHPVTAVIDEICAIFREIGFTRVTGPEAETEEYNFVKLNIPLDHPAADEHDTFFLVGREDGSPKGEWEPPGRLLLRTHTSPMQARTMEKYTPPIRIVVPGQVYRRDPFDPSHSPAFEQIEGLVVDDGVSFVDFKAGIDYFVKHFFSADTEVRFRPSFFPFTEPSAEVDVQCQMCKGSGCTTCKQTGFLEIMGAGMVHPAVFERCGIDPEVYTGYAFGMGPHRIAMLRHGIPDIRMLYLNDMRFLNQFVGAP